MGNVGPWHELGHSFGSLVDQERYEVQEFVRADLLTEIAGEAREILHGLSVLAEGAELAGGGHSRMGPIGIARLSCQLRDDFDALIRNRLEKA